MGCWFYRQAQYKSYGIMVASTEILKESLKLRKCVTGFGVLMSNPGSCKSAEGAKETLKKLRGDKKVEHLPMEALGSIQSQSKRVAMWGCNQKTHKSRAA
jgi:hypothetical protein